jgi:hypothetical protein
MYRTLSIVLVIVVVALGIFIWSSDRITLEGERTIYSVACQNGTWEGLRCTGRLSAGDRYRFRASRSRREIVYWIAGSSGASGKYTDCDVTDRDRWSCKPSPGDIPSIAHALSDGRPVPNAVLSDLPFHAVNKWKWWALDAGIPIVSSADYSNTVNPRVPRMPPPEPARR